MSKKKITDFTPDPHNANLGTERGLRALDDSLREVGLGRSIVVDKNGIVLAGNKTQERAVDLGFEEAIVVPTDGRQLVVVQRTDLDLNNPKDKRARKYSYYDNRVAQLDLKWDMDAILDDIDAGLDLANLFHFDPLPVEPDDKVVTDAPDENAPEALKTLSDLAEPSAIIFPSDNDWGVPTLRLDMQAKAVIAPVTKWGVIGRTSVMSGTYHFYTDDYKFAGAYNDPNALLASGCVSAVELNYSTHTQMSRAEVLWGIYRKRWLARHWQERGVTVFVDVNIEERFWDLALLGVPREWAAFCNRGYDRDAQHLVTAYSKLVERKGSRDLLYVVVGGGDTTEKLAQEYGWLWIPEQSDVVRGRRTQEDK